MIEEIDYSEEAKYDLFESVKKEKSHWASCFISQMAPSFEQVKKELEKKDLSISKKDYDTICKELGLKPSSL